MKLIMFLLFLLLLNCSKKNVNPNTTVQLPTSSVNYAQLDNWAFHPLKNGTMLDNYDLDIAVINPNLTINSFIRNTNNAKNNTGIDVFFVHPTQLNATNTNIENVAILDQPAVAIGATILAQAGLLSKYGRFFAPRYRQATGPTFKIETAKDVQAAIITNAYVDIKAAFMHYLQNYNNGNKIILAGHSQGSYLLALLLKDVFDNDAALRSKLVTAALGGMGYTYNGINDSQNGWWQNFKLGSTINECGTIHNWLSAKEEDSLPSANTGLPAFNQNLVNNGLIKRIINLSEDKFTHDELFYNSTQQFLRYYIVADANYNLGGIKNYIAFDNMYKVRFRRDAATKVALSVAYSPAPNEQRPNDLASLNGNNTNFPNWGYHPKDYNIYLWALMQQIDAKILNCR